MIYFDFNSTTPVLPEVLEEIIPFFTDSFGNASSAHKMGKAAQKAIENAREQVASLIGAEPNEIIFTSGATESNQTILRMFECDKESSLLISSVEHPSILKIIEKWSKNRFHLIPVNTSGIVSIEKIQESSAKGLCSVIWGNNETGVISPIDEISEWAKEHNLFFHTDAVQAVGKIPVNVKDFPIDYLSLSSHKIYGPKGIGALYIREGAPFKPLIIGSQENSLRGGTENVPLIVGFGKAAELAQKDLTVRSKRVKELRDKLEHGVLREIEDTSVNGGDVERLPNTTNIHFSGVDGDTLVSLLSQKNIAISTSSACNSSAITPSHVLLAMGKSYEEAGEAVRFSLSHLTSESDLEKVIETLKESVHLLRN